jgi:hypothetical protein
MALTSVKSNPTSAAYAMLHGTKEEEQEEVLGSILQFVHGIPATMRLEIEASIKNLVSRQAHFGGILEYTAQQFVTDSNTKVLDWNQTTVNQTNYKQLMPLILNHKGPETIFLKSRFELSMVNSDASEIVEGHTWSSVKLKAKGKDAIEPDVVVCKIINGKLYIYIIELKIGAGQAGNDPKEHLQLMRGKRLFQLYFAKMIEEGLIPASTPIPKIRLYFCAWMHNSKKTTVDFKRFKPVAGLKEYDVKELAGPDAYASLVGVNGRFISAMIKKLDYVRFYILAKILKKFFSKGGRYTNAAAKLAANLNANINKIPGAANIARTLPQIIPGGGGKGHSEKAVGFARAVARNISFKPPSKSASHLSNIELKRKIRRSREKALIRYQLFADRYKARAKRAGQASPPANKIMQAFLNPSPTSPIPANSVNIYTNRNIGARLTKYTNAMASAVERSNTSLFNTGKSEAKSFINRVLKSAKTTAAAKQWVTGKLSQINSYSRPISPKATGGTKRKAGNTAGGAAKRSRSNTNNKIVTWISSVTGQKVTPTRAKTLAKSYGTFKQLISNIEAGTVNVKKSNKVSKAFATSLLPGKTGARTTAKMSAVAENNMGTN